MASGDLDKIAKELAPNKGDEAFYVNVNQPEHLHSGQTSGATHADGYHITNDGSGPKYDKYHSDDK